ncbi:hypothetical protein HOLleu_36108 [Holothuria leucospilota]|uniref:Uncharacterized protein n=1 Tax=Holothuria leucospilota TaxID=206669 RepID=A0A9Q0YJD4_HOLLE|nr:hypothetical protein HOLleu_36108 [Holothuria leucospilota]
MSVFKLTSIKLCLLLFPDENVREVNVGGRPTFVRGMTLEDNSAKIKLSLWREKTTSPVKIGDFIHVSNLAITRFNNESTAGTTIQSEIKVLQPPQEERNLTVDGYLQTDEENWELITEDGKSLKVNAQILSKHLQVEASNLEDALACLMPWNIDVVMMGIQ